MQEVKEMGTYQRYLSPRKRVFQIFWIDLNASLKYD